MLCMHHVESSDLFRVSFSLKKAASSFGKCVPFYPITECYSVAYTYSTLRFFVRVITPVSFHGKNSVLYLIIKLGCPCFIAAEFLSRRDSDIFECRMLPSVSSLQGVIWQ